VSAPVEDKQEQQTRPRPWHKGVSDFLGPLLAAVQFLTVAPAVVRRPFRAAELGRAVGWFPLVGLLLGGVLAALDGALGLLFPPAVKAALVLAAWALATGVLHLDGLLDSCDGLFGGRTPEARLRIMRDERVGAFAVIGGVFAVLLKYAALAALPGRTPALVVAPVLGRWGMALAIVAFPYARAEGLGRAMKDHAGRREATLASATAALAAMLIGRGAGLTALVLAGAVTWLGGRWVLRRLPGFTGDVYGALCEVLEILALLVFVASEKLGGGS
jgi:adenosylcobinamide-GDP ribazoletransferase